MKLEKQITSLIVLSIILSVVLGNVLVMGSGQAEIESAPDDLVISGLVDCPTSFPYKELQGFPMVSEVALVLCLDPLYENKVANWTGIPLFFLLSLTGVKAEATEVVFYASDGYSASLTIERALHPTTLVALKANGTVLSHADGYPYRLVVPCKWGYMWVKWITKIEVVGSQGFYVESDMPNCTIPSTKPPYETFDVVLGSTTYSVVVLSNSTINFLNFAKLGKQICLNVTGPPSTKGYCYTTIPKELLWCDTAEQWQVWVNNILVEERKVIETTNSTYIYFTYDHSTQEIQIEGVYAIPEFSKRIPILLLLIIPTVAFAIYKRRPHKTPTH